MATDAETVPRPGAGQRLGPQSPWPGLSAFGEEDSDFFRGRDDEAEELARLVRRERLTVLFGRSGLGKSSLLGAGLFPRLRQDQHLPVLLRIAYGAGVTARQQVWDALQRACAQWGVEAATPAVDESLWTYFHRAGAGFWNARHRPVTPVLVFDQFEEIFTLGQANDAARGNAADFAEELAGLVEDRPSEALRRAVDADPIRAETIDYGRRGCKVVLSFREDFLAEVEGLRSQMPSLMRNRFRLTPMNAAQARAVMASGAQLVDEGVAPHILGLAWRNQAQPPTAEEEERLEIDPALLSVICSELNQRRMTSGQPRISAQLLQGAESSILVDFYERALTGLDSRVRVFVEDELITEAGYRDSHAYDDALRLPGVMRTAVDHLIDTRLLRVDDRFGVRRLELTHDVLTSVVKSSRDARQAREAEAAALDRERRAARAQARNRRAVALIAVAAVAALGLLAWALKSSVDAVQARQAAEMAASSAKADRAMADAALDQAKVSEQRANEARRVADVRAVEVSEQEERARRAEIDAEAARVKATAQERAALAADLIVRARSAPVTELDRALLVGAEGVRQFPDRQDIQIEQFGRLLKAPRIAARLSLSAGLSAWWASADGSQMALATRDNGIQLVDTGTWQPGQRYQLQTEALAVALEPTARRMVVIDRRQLVVWDTETASVVAQWPTGVPIQAPPSLAISRDGRWISLAQGTDLRWWPMPVAGDPPPALAGSTRVDDGVRCHGFSNDSTLLLHAGEKEAQAWALRGTEAAKVTAKGQILASSDDCRRVVLVTGAADKATGFEVRDTASGKLLVQEERTLRYSPRFRFLGNGQALMLSGAAAATVWRFAEAAGGRAPAPVRLRIPAAEVLAADISSDGRWLAMAVAGRRLVLFRMGEDSAAEVPDFMNWRLPRDAMGLQFGVKGDSLLALQQEESSTNLQQALTVWELRHGQRLQLDGSAYDADELEFNATGSVLATAASKGGMHFWDPVSARVLRAVPNFTTTAFSPDGTLAAIYRRRDNRIDVVAMKGSQQPIMSHAVPGEQDVRSLAIRGDNRQLAVVTGDGAVWVQDFAGDSSPHRLNDTLGAAQALAFSRDGRTIAVGGRDGGVWLLRSDGGGNLRVMDKKHKGAVIKLAFSDEGDYVASGGRDGVARVHSTRDNRTVAEFAGHESEVNALVFVQGAGGPALVAGSAKGHRKVWDVARRDWLTDLGSADSDIRSVELAADRKGVVRRAAVLHRDETVSLHDWSPPALLADACRLANRNLQCSEWQQYFPNKPYHRTCEKLPAQDCSAAGVAQAAASATTQPLRAR